MGQGMVSGWEARAQVRKVALVTGVAVVTLAAVAAGLYFRHYVSLTLFCTWLAVEWRLHRPLLRTNARPGESIANLLRLYKRADAAAEALLAEKIASLQLGPSLSDREKLVLERLQELSQLRGLAFGSAPHGKKRLRQAFAYAKEIAKERAEEDAAYPTEQLELQDIADAATIVADLYWKLFQTCQGGYPELKALAQTLYADLFGVAFTVETARPVIERLTDTMQREGGIPWLILNLLRRNRAPFARDIAQRLLTGGLEVDEDVRSTVYWISELTWFKAQPSLFVSDFEATIRYLYHLCFTNPERAGFLEIDSRFFAQFETVSELAREGFLFKETLFDKVLDLWETHDGFFDGVFCGVLEAMTQSKSKIYHERDNWVRLWARERDRFCRDHLYVVEGNLSYAAGRFDDARLFYEKALFANPRSRPARLNLVFAFAKLGDTERHEAAVDRVLSDRTLEPTSLFVVGNSYLLLGDGGKAEACYDELRERDGWARKADFYQSTFCYENGLFEKALETAKLAHEKSPADSSVSYHLSLCYAAVGQKDEALTLVRRIPSNREAQWLDYYRFTLERDAGQLEEAAETLLSIPSDYFEDPEELEAALEFARGRQDLALLRHLRARGR